MVFGYYTVFDKIGQGGMGVVLKARHQRLDRIVAIKVLPRELLASTEAVERFYREVKAAARLTHPNIVTAYDAGENKGTHYFVMEYVQGEDLAHLGHRRGPLPLPEAVDYTLQTAKGLEYAHSQGVVHRDIKPGNLLLDASGTVKILDMGLARFEQGLEDHESAPLTRSGQVMGTAGYMAPEQAENTHQADHRADIYSLGCSLYRLLTNKAMYSGEDPRPDPPSPIATSRSPSLRDRRPDVPEELDRIYQKMVAKRPEDRYHSMREAIAALEPCLEMASLGADTAPTADFPRQEKSDSNLRSFLQQFSPGGETIRQQVDMETGQTLPPVPKKKSQPWWLYVGIAVGVLVIVALGAAFLGSKDQTARNTNPSTAEGTLERDLHWQQSEGTRTERAAEQPPVAPVETVPKSGEAASELTSQQTDPSAESRMEPEEPQTVPPAVDPAEAARRELLEQQRAIEAKFTAAMKPVEEKIAAWNFAGAWEAAKTVRFDDKSLEDRLETRRGEIRRMGLLKRQIIAKIVQADPPLKKFDLGIRGLGGVITDAGQGGITTKTIKGEVERLTWDNLGSQATSKLIDLAIDPGDAEGCVAAGLLAFQAGDLAASERFFARAKAAGTDVSAQLAAVAASELADATELLSEGKFAQAHKILDSFNTKYAGIPWLAANRNTVNAMLAEARHGIREEEAEQLYAEAVKLHERKALFELRDVLERLTGEFSDCRPSVDPQRRPSVAQLRSATADLGARTIVRLDGRGDFKSIQAAIDAAGPNGLIEIQDNGPYAEYLLVPSEKTGLEIRGAQGCWPVITSANAPGEDHVRTVQGKEVDTLVRVQANARMERVVLAHVAPHCNKAEALAVKLNSLDLRLSIVYTPAGEGLSCDLFADTEVKVRECLILTSMNSRTHVSSVNSLWFGRVRFGGGGGALRSCFVPRGVSFSPHDANVAIDCILGDISVNDGIANDIQYCNLVDAKQSTIYQKDAIKACFSAPPRFRDPANLDYRLVPDSPGTRAASDGGDIGVRYTPELMELCRVALELRMKGVIKF